jgi:transcription antitermination factor NusG
LAAFCAKEGIFHQLPLFRSPKSYRGKSLVFLKPLFPGYVFLRPAPDHIHLLRQNRHLARLLHPPDQAEFAAQLGAILLALEANREVRLAPHIAEGQKVRLCTGPLRGLEGFVERREGVIDVILRLDFITQAAAVKVSANEVEQV